MLRPGSAEYGSFSVYVNYHCRPRYFCFTGLFYPAAQSHFQCNNPDTEGKPDFVDNEKMFSGRQSGFAQRRKTLVNSCTLYLAASLIGKAYGDYQGLRANENIRGETLGIVEFAAISNFIGQALDRT